MKEELGVPKEYLIDYSSLKVGDEVWGSRYGRGTVIGIEHDHEYPIEVRFKSLSISTFTTDGFSYIPHEYASLFKSNPFAALKKQNLPRMVEVRSYTCDWTIRELVADLSREDGNKRPYVTRNPEHGAFHAWEKMREIEPPQKEETFETVWAKTYERIIKGVIDGMPDETFEFEFSEGKVKITKVK